MARATGMYPRCLLGVYFNEAEGLLVTADNGDRIGSVQVEENGRWEFIHSDALEVQPNQTEIKLCFVFLEDGRKSFFRDIRRLNITDFPVKKPIEINLRVKQKLQALRKVSLRITVDGHGQELWLKDKEYPDLTHHLYHRKENFKCVVTRTVESPQWSDHQFLHKDSVLRRDSQKTVTVSLKVVDAKCSFKPKKRKISLSRFDSSQHGTYSFELRPPRGKRTCRITYSVGRSRHGFEVDLGQPRNAGQVAVQNIAQNIVHGGTLNLNSVNGRSEINVSSGHD